MHNDATLNIFTSKNTKNNINYYQTTVKIKEKN